MARKYAQRYSVLEQRATVARWLLGNGRRRSEAAVEASAMGEHRLRLLHQRLKRLLEAGELELVRADVYGETVWVIRAKVGGS